MTSEKKDHLKRGNIEAKRLLDTNNSVRSDTSDKLFSMLEAGESSGIPRDQIDQLLIDIAKRTFRLDTDKIWKDLRTLLSVKDKIAFITAHAYSKWLTENNKYNNEKLKKKLDKTLKLLECNLMQNQEFTESRILRNAAFNHFSCKLNTSEQSDLNSVWSKLKKLCQDNWYDSLAESTHFTAESNAQKIMNYNEVARQLTAIWVAIDWDTLAKITKLEEKVKPLKDLNRKYINLSNNLALTSEIAKKWYKSMIHVSNQKKLRSFLTDLWKKETDFFLPEADSFSENQFATLEETLRQLKLADRAKYDELLKKYSTTDNQFSEWFLVYFSFKNVEKAKNELDSQKMKTFWNELKDYEQTATKRKWWLRDKIFAIWRNMTWDQSNRHGGKNTIDFASDEEFEVANSYFNKFQNIFYASERDAYGTEAHDKESHYLTMRNTIAAIIRRRGGDAIKNGSHKRYGSLPRKAMKRLEWFAKWQEEKWMLKLLKKTRHHADHAEILAMVIMLQNQASQQMFHGKNTFQKKDSRIWKMRHGLSLAEEWRQKFWETISPYTSKFMRFAETSTKGIVGKPVVRWAQRYNKKLLGKSLSLTQEWELSKTTNGTWKYKRRKTPFYAALPVTRILAKWKDGYNNTKKYLWEVKWENVNYLYESLNDTVDTITSIGWKTAETIWTKSYEQYETNQQRSVLDTFFSLASEDEKWKEVIQSCNLAWIFNFNNRETYLFDEDGRVPMLEAPEVKEKNTPEWSAAEFGSKLQKQLDTIVQQAKENINKEKENQEKANNNDDEKRKIEADINLANANETKNIVNKVQSEAWKLIPILKKVMSNPVPPATPTRRHTDINTVVNNINNLMTSTPDWLITKEKKEIWDIKTKWSLKYTINQSKNNLAKHSANVTILQSKVNWLTNNLRNARWVDITTITTDLEQASKDLMKSQKAKELAETQYFEDSRKLRHSEKMLWWLENFNENIQKLWDINNRMSTALTTNPQWDIKVISEELLELAKNLDLLLQPEKKSDWKIINLNSITEEKRKEIEKLLAA